MYTFKFDNKHYTAYGQNEVGNPHVKGYPCIVDLTTDAIAVKQQKSICRAFLAQNNLDYHEIISYAEKDINSHDMVNALLKFHALRKL